MNNGKKFPRGFSVDLAVVAGVSQPAAWNAMHDGDKSAWITSCIKPLFDAMLDNDSRRLSENQLVRLGARIRKEQLREQSRSIGKRS